MHKFLEKSKLCVLKHSQHDPQNGQGKSVNSRAIAVMKGIAAA